MFCKKYRKKTCSSHQNTFSFTKKMIISMRSFKWLNVYSEPTQTKKVPAPLQGRVGIPAVWATTDEAILSPKAHIAWLGGPENAGNMFKTAHYLTKGKINKVRDKIRSVFYPWKQCHSSEAALGVWDSLRHDPIQPTLPVGHTMWQNIFK